MEKISENEIMGLLGYHDLSHSYKWYRTHFPDLPVQIREYIIDELGKYKTFPRNISNLDQRTKCKEFNYTVEMENGQYVVNYNNTDRGEISSSKSFKDMSDAVNYLINISYGISGSIKQYWT
jgi:hypothetical protein